MSPELAPVIKLEDNLTVSVVRPRVAGKSHPFGNNSPQILKWHPALRKRLEGHAPKATNAEDLGEAEMSPTGDAERADTSPKEGVEKANIVISKLRFLEVAPEPGPSELSSHDDGSTSEKSTDEGHDEEKSTDQDLGEEAHRNPEARRSLASKSFRQNCEDIHEILAKTDALQTIVIALESDLAALALLESIQDTLGARAAHVRCLVLVKDLLWAEPITMLNGVPLHDFVSSHAATVLAATTPFGEDAVLVPATTDQSAWSDEYLHFYDGNILYRCCDQGRT